VPKKISSFEKNCSKRSVPIKRTVGAVQKFVPSELMSWSCSTPNIGVVMKHFKNEHIQKRALMSRL
jgi:hypothetical protein